MPLGTAHWYLHKSGKARFLGLSPSPPDAGRRRGPGRGGAFVEIPLSPTLSPLVPRGERENLCRYQWGQRGGGRVHQPHPTSHALVASPGGGSAFERAARDPEWNSAQA